MNFLPFLFPQKILEQYDHDQDGIVNFEDFVSYVQEHEVQLKLSFEKLDHNKDGKSGGFDILLWFKFSFIARIFG
jgi:solute carrier family 25 phosphate transporter 23/24/25/41